MKRYTVDNVTVDDVNRLFRADVTADEINSLFRAATNGDKAAIKRIDKYCRELWRDHPDIAAEFDMPKSCTEALETSEKLKAKITATIDDPISKQIRPYIEAIRQSDDPVWGALLDMPAREFRQAVYTRMGQSIAVLPSVEQSRIRVPHKPAALKRWREVWRSVKGMWNTTQNYAKIAEWYNEKHTGNTISPETMADIIRAGDAGRLST